MPPTAKSKTRMVRLPLDLLERLERLREVLEHDAEMGVYFPQNRAMGRWDSRITHADVVVEAVRRWEEHLERSKRKGVAA